MKKLALIATLCLVCLFTYAQTSTPKTESEKETKSDEHDLKKNKDTYIFLGNIELQECNAVGIPSDGTSIIAYKNNLFTIAAKTDDSWVISFLVYKDLAKQIKYNYKNAPDTKVAVDDNKKYFLLPFNKFESIATEYIHDPAFNVSFGTLVNPIKYRPTKSEWSSNISLGASVETKWRMTKNQAIGAVFGFSVGAIKLDSLSTNGKVKKDSDRPAFTPSFHFVYAYKNINFLVGLGWDFINRPSEAEQSWVYHGKHWIGFGIGVNLFTSHDSDSNKSTGEQKGK